MSESSPRSKHKSTSPFVFLLPVVFFLGLGSGFLLWGRTASSAATSTPSARRINVSAGNAPSLGPANAPVTIIEFGDYQCPYCKLWHEQVYDRLMANYPDQVRFIYRDFPLPMHPDALPAAEAAACALQQNAFWKFHDALFSQAGGLGRPAYDQYARDLGLDLSAFDSCLDSHRTQSAINASAQYATGLGVDSTPTFFIDGIPVIGAQPYEVFQQIVDQELLSRKKQ
jgi:protein-disulfide isomerase